MSKEYGSLLSMWRDAVSSFSVDAAAYDPVLITLSVKATVCMSLELVDALGSALLRRCGGDVTH